MDAGGTIAVICILIILSAYFSATETAFSSINKIRMKNLAQEGNKKAKLSLKLCEKFEKLMDKLNTELVLIHRHDNNFGGYFSNEHLAKVYELTFVNKKYIENKIINDIILPLENLDYPNKLG